MPCPGQRRGQPPPWRARPAGGRPEQVAVPAEAAARGVGGRDHRKLCQRCRRVSVRAMRAGHTAARALAGQRGLGRAGRQQRRVAAFPGRSVTGWASVSARVARVGRRDLPAESTANVLKGFAHSGRCEVSFFCLGSVLVPCCLEWCCRGCVSVLHKALHFGSVVVSGFCAFSFEVRLLLWGTPRLSAHL